MEHCFLPNLSIMTMFWWKKVLSWDDGERISFHLDRLYNDQDILVLCSNYLERSGFAQGHPVTYVRQGALSLGIKIPHWRIHANLKTAFDLPSYLHCAACCWWSIEISKPAILSKPCARLVKIACAESLLPWLCPPGRAGTVLGVGLQTLILQVALCSLLRKGVLSCFQAPLLT